MKKSIILGTLICAVLCSASAGNIESGVSSDGEVGCVSALSCIFPDVDTYQWWDCDICDGTGHDPRIKCRACLGKGWIYEEVKCTYLGCNNGKVYDRYGKPYNCPSCGGSGKVKDRVNCTWCDGYGHPECKKCGGTGKVREN